jgi:hypothetical protein
MRATAEKNGINHHMCCYQEASAPHRRRLIYVAVTKRSQMTTKQTPPAIQPGQTRYGVHEATVLWRALFELAGVSVQLVVCVSEEGMAYNVCSISCRTTDQSD